LEFVETLLSVLVTRGIGVVVVPMNCALGTTCRDTREKLLKKHTLEAVFSMPTEIFNPSASVPPCVMVWTANVPHPAGKQTFFGYYRDDGFVKRKKLGRVDASGRWETIKNEWLSLYKERDVKAGLSAKRIVTHNDEWCAEAYLETDYSKLKTRDFEQKVKEYVAYKFLKDSKHETVGWDTENWKKFKLECLFVYIRGKGITKAEIDNHPGLIPCVQSGEINNGIIGFMNSELKNDKKHSFVTAPFLSVARSGTSGCVNVQDEDSYVGDSAYALKLKDEKENIYRYLFLAVILNMERYRYTYGRKVSIEKYIETYISLPADKNGEPDWQFMENYIKKLPCSEKI
jgi:hypothetical protein